MVLKHARRKICWLWLPEVRTMIKRQKVTERGGLTSWHCWKWARGKALGEYLSLLQMLGKSRVFGHLRDFLDLGTLVSTVMCDILHWLEVDYALFCRIPTLPFRLLMHYSRLCSRHALGESPANGQMSGVPEGTMYHRGCLSVFLFLINVFCIYSLYCLGPLDIVKVKQ